MQCVGQFDAHEWNVYLRQDNWNVIGGSELGGLCYYYWQIKQRTVTVPRNQLRRLLCLSEGFPHIRHQTDVTRNFLKIFFTIENNFVTFFKIKALKVLNALSLCRTYMYLFILNDFFFSCRALFVCSGNANGLNTPNDITWSSKETHDYVIWRQWWQLRCHVQ